MPMNIAVPACRRPFDVDDAAGRVASARRMVKHALAMSDVRDRDRRWLVGMALWRLTEFERSDRYKYGIRFRTEAVVLGPAAAIQHEHVVEMVWLKAELFTLPELADATLDLAVSCVVTEKEHQWLKTHGAGRFGWERYLGRAGEPGLVVLDTAAPGMPPVELDVLVEGQQLALAALRSVA